MSAPAQIIILVRNVVSMLSHRIISRAMVLRGHPIVWSLTLCPEDTKKDPVVHDTEFGVVFLAKGPLIASIQEGLDCLGLYYSGLEGERYFRLVLEFT